MSRPCDHAGKEPDRRCQVCRAAWLSEPFARLWGERWPAPPLPEGFAFAEPGARKAAGPPAPAPSQATPPSPPSPPRPPCVHLGVIVEYCLTCGGNEGRHVRDCGHPENPTETCTLARSGGVVWDCATCPHHTPAAPGPPG